MHEIIEITVDGRSNLLLRLPVGRGGVINSPRFCFFFPVSKVGAPLMGDTAVHSLSHDFKLNF